MALGAAEITLIEQTSAYSVFPNDGVRVTPRYITKVTDYEGRVLEEDFPDVKDVISSRTARIMTSMLREVVLHGTGVAAAKLPFPVAGKTGTTNDFTDAWFVGFSPTMTCGVWVGYDEKKSLGAKETGAHAALPIWMHFMTVALAGKDPGRFSAVAAGPACRRAKSRYARHRPGNGRGPLKEEQWEGEFCFAASRLLRCSLISPSRPTQPAMKRPLLNEPCSRSRKLGTIMTLTASCLATGTLQN